jgi:hypothetical protein
MLLFRSEENIAVWCRSNRMARGKVLPLGQVWELSKAWYGDRLSPGYQGHGVADVDRIFESVGLTGRFWSIASQPTT